MTSIKNHKIIIEGITEEGKPFRPSDWAERVSGTLSTFDSQHRIAYSPLLQPMIKDGNQCVLLDPALQETNPALYKSIMTFVKANHLKICNKNN